MSGSVEETFYTVLFQKTNLEKIMECVLLFSHDSPCHQRVEKLLAEKNIKLLFENTFTEAWKQFITNHPCLVIVDISDKVGNRGTEFAERVRKTKVTPVLFVTDHVCAHNYETVKHLLPCDVVSKSATNDEFEFRLNVLTDTNNCRQLLPKKVELGKCCYDSQKQGLCSGEKTISLNNLQNRMMYFLTEDVGCFVPRTTLVKKIWGTTDYQMKGDALNTLTSSLRKALGDATGLTIESKINSGVRISK